MISTQLAGALAAGPVATLGPDWLNAQTLIERFGAYALIGVVIVVFIETGLLFPLLPGDSLLFTAGALVAQDELHFPLWLLCLMVFAAAFAGDQNAYWIGRRLGPKVFNRPDSRFFRREHIDETYRYFDRYGGMTVIIARFVPFVRTYASVAAGVGRMHYRRFVTFDLVGALLWGVGVTMLGYLLGNITFVKDHIELLLVGIVALSVVPVAIGWLRAWRNRRSGAPEEVDRYEDPAERRRVEREDIRTEVQDG
ncbi:VTT domain-containing protein [Isoptericola sp. b441]|uniref:VTT domain-containing protein n=1 Tax=Actinotalea lenta TaxID=3064654 RepID=A0ABT9D6W8_9CELL|nr:MULTISPECIES: VTT domain-containing protein [unclassified Isoptericola]MDO8105924.1 VTT domain-containing protein [Isoptericola sp. b441]MDO8122639.1 VTT domain-containing protein [Isoptericola sp. b490]